VRREKRTQVDEPARLHPNHWSSLEVRVLDLSSNGFRAECEARVTIGSSVRLEVPGVGPLNAHVTWRRGDRFGAKFDEPADLSHCEWQPVCDQVALARMLVDRAQARDEGQFGRELELRRKILDALPMHPLGQAAARSSKAGR
jgi:hypothetical protein